MYPSFNPMGNKPDANALVAHNYRPIPEVDAALGDAICAVSGGPGGWVPLVKASTKYHEMTDKRLNEAIATALGLPPVNGLAAAYLRRATHKFANMMVKKELYVCVSQAKPTPTVIPTAPAPMAMPKDPMPTPVIGEGMAQPSQDAALPKNERIEDFAYVAWAKILPRLKEYAFDENWGANYWVLRNKIMYTFQWLYRRWCEAKTEAEKGHYIYIAPDRTFAAINLGLADKMPSEMFLTFFPNGRGQPYWYAGESSIITKMAYAPRNPAAAKLGEKERPQWPYFIRSAEEIAFMPGAEIRPPAPEHLFKRLERFPDAALRRFCQDDAEVLQLCEAAIALRAQHRALNADLPFIQDQQFQVDFLPLSQAFANSTPCHRNLDREFASAIEDLKRRIKWNYRTLVPAYYPKNDRPNAPGGCISLLAPLNFSLGNPDNIDVVMVLAYDKQTKAYQGSTILTPAMAYSNARLLCRLNDNWLDAAFV